jgi:glucose-6-phosphate 1-epimerase
LLLLWPLVLAAQQMPPAAPPASDTVPAIGVADQAAFAACLPGLRQRAQRAGISDVSFDRHVAPLQPDMSVLPLLDSQPEFTTPLWDYLAALVDTQRIADGQAMLQTHAAVLEQVSAGSGVDAATIVAVWGVESDYGRVTGKRPLLQSLSTLSCFGRRQAFFGGELTALLSLLQSGDLSAEGLTGSWAGAFGQTQFMPSTYQRLAVDGDGDGRRDLVASVADALASTGNFLQQAGWQRGQAWGYEINVPAGFDAGQAGRRARRPLRDWIARGVTRADGQPITEAAEQPAAVLLPTGVEGPAFLVFRNYDAIYGYNAAESYALAIALLSDRLRGGDAVRKSWPTDDPGIGRDERRRLQQLLIARGHALGAPDGLVGTETRKAIVIEQTRLGLTPTDGRAGRKILDALQADPTPLPQPPPIAVPW